MLANGLQLSPVTVVGGRPGTKDPIYLIDRGSGTSVRQEQRCDTCTILRLRRTTPLLRGVNMTPMPRLVLCARV